MKAGAAYRDITPDWPVHMQGYGSRNRKSDGVDDNLRVGCVALDSEGSRMLILCYDMVGMQAADAAIIKEAVSGETGTAPDKILISCSHTHFAPGVSASVFLDPELGLVGPDSRHVRMVIDRSVVAATAAIGDLKDGEIKTYRTHLPQVSFNRRVKRPDGKVETHFLYPEKTEELAFQPVDDELSVIQFEAQTGRRIYLLNFGCHPVTGGQNRETSLYNLSADYIHFLRIYMEERENCSVFFTLGAAGDSVPKNRGGFCRGLIGAALGSAALLGERAYRTAENQDQLKTALFSLKGTLNLAIEEGITADYDRLRNKLRSIPEGERTAEAVSEYEDRLYRAFKRQTYPEGSHEIVVQLLRIGETVIAALPFEVLSKFSLEIKKRFPKALLVSCANGYEGYLPFSDDIKCGGYEGNTRSYHFTDGTAEKLLELVLEKLSGF